MPDLLLELRSEEIPARMQRKAAGDLKKLVTDALVEAGLTYEAAREYWTPRRLTLDVRGLTAASKDVNEQRKGPSTKAPQQAIDGFMRASGLTSIDEAQIVSDPKKGDYYVANIVKKGRRAQEIIADIMPGIIRNFPWPKSMRWGANSVTSGSLKWVRPLQSIVCVLATENLESEIVSFEVDGLQSSNVTYGHRFLSDNTPIELRRFDDYVAHLDKAKVILDAQRRKDIILSDAHNLSFANGLELVEDEALAEEVAGLVEWPVVMLGTFEPEFLVIPPEIIRLTIRTNQKCFVTRKQGEQDALSNHFILIANIVPEDGGQEIVSGNGKVVRARLSDALYFWNTDQADLPDLAQLRESADSLELDLSKPLDQRMARLDHLDVTFHARLGTQGARVRRIVNLASVIALQIGANPEYAKRAAVLAKADLQTEAVGEFPELQGLMGHKYALLQGEPEEVAAAIENHYRPQGPNDYLPRDPVSVAVALADKIDTLVGFWMIDEKPTGSKDPYALRRAALGVIRLALSQEWVLPLRPLMKAAFENFSLVKIEKKLAKLEDKLQDDSIPDTDEQQDIDNVLRHAHINIENRLNDDVEPVLEDLLRFFHDRLKVHLRDEGARYDAIDAVLDGSQDDLLQIARRVEALIAFMNHNQDSASLFAGVKRAANILDAERKKQTLIADQVDQSLLQQEEEQALYKAIATVDALIQEQLEQGDYAAALTALEQLVAPIDAFFDKVLVNDENLEIRANRLALLQQMQTVTSKVADFSKLVI